MVELFKLKVLKFAAAKDGRTHMIEKDFELTGSALQLIASPSGRRPDGSSAFHRLTPGPLPLEASMELAAVEFTGTPARSNGAASTVPEKVDDIEAWKAAHAKEGWRV